MIWSWQSKIGWLVKLCLKFVGIKQIHINGISSKIRLYQLATLVSYISLASSASAQWVIPELTMNGVIWHINQIVFPYQARCFNIDICFLLQVYIAYLCANSRLMWIISCTLLSQLVAWVCCANSFWPVSWATVSTVDESHVFCFHVCCYSHFWMALIILTHIL